MRLCFPISFPVHRVTDLLNDYVCVCGDTESPIGDDGVRDIAEALKANSTLVEIDLRRE